MKDSTRQTKCNLLTNILVLIANVLVGVFYTPYLVKSLGLAAYGVLPIALIINQYIGVATQTLTHAYTRFYSVALQKGDYFEASKVISTSLVVVLVICTILIPFGGWIVYDANHLFQIPSEILVSTKKLFAYTIISFLISLLASLLNVTLYAINRLDIMNYLKLIRVSFKLGLIILLFEFIRVDVSLVGLSNLLTEAVILLLSTIFFFKYKPSGVNISLHFFDKSVLVAIFGMSVWVLFQLCGDTLLYRTDNLIVNHFWGTVASGALGAISEIGGYISLVVSVIGSLFGPLILKEYAKGNHNEVKSLFLTQSSIVGCLAAILSGVISGCSFTVLEVWLGEGMGDYQWWLLIKMIVLPFYAAGGIMAFVYRSWNRMKLPAIGTIVLGALNIAILIAFCSIESFHSVIGVLTIGAFFSIAQCFVLNAISVSKIYPDSKKFFAPISLKILSTFLLAFILGKSATTIIYIKNLIQLCIVIMALCIIMLAIVFILVLNKNEKKGLLELIK